MEVLRLAEYDHARSEMRKKVDSTCVHTCHTFSSHLSVVTTTSQRRSTAGCDGNVQGHLVVSHSRPRLPLAAAVPFTDNSFG